MRENIGFLSTRFVFSSLFLGRKAVDLCAFKFIPTVLILIQTRRISRQAINKLTKEHQWRHYGPSTSWNQRTNTTDKDFLRILNDKNRFVCENYVCIYLKTGRADGRYIVWLQAQESRRINKEKRKWHHYLMKTSNDRKILLAFTFKLFGPILVFIFVFVDHSVRLRPREHMLWACMY